MAYVEPTQVVTGQPITAAKWNQDVVDNTLALYNTPGTLWDRFGKGGFIPTISALMGETTLIPFPNVTSPIYENQVDVSNTEYKIDITVGGIYTVFAHIVTASTTSTNNGSLFAGLASGQFLASRTFQHPAIGGGLANNLSICQICKLSSGDSVFFYFKQNLIASLDYEVMTIGLHWIGSGV